ncbi:uncharacterized protein LOC110252563 [Exaiptasia diaphana]|uniref:Uncharacterized protein n=1 Tax=Exaiptasia diaphana TaxID=2652724 RepID=A0A913Y6C0_EXADI|nr:uncharacterized protein LOC110252563 [Exaiptasia diaphana]
MKDVSTPANPKRNEDWIYKSTYTNSYTGTDGLPAPNGRVRTSQFYPSGRPYLDSTYRTDFMRFPTNKRESVPYGSSSGYRKNNPHPHNMQSAFKHPCKDYFVWSPYQRLPPLGNTVDGLNSQILLQRVCQDKTRSIYQQDFKQPPYATATLAYSNCRRAVGTSSYKDAFEGTHGQAAQSAKPEPYGFPSLDKFETSTYRRDFRKTKTLQLPLLPSSPTRRNNPHPVTMNNAFIFPNRGYWIWPHRLIPMKYEDNSITLCLSNDLLKDKKRGPFETWQKEN